ncbi:hypothetical protein J7T55_015350 [Diaporthe amygdali]|uniref:uncharacterized protein n=1 Tax=Phomopsis amygdali TaxID=1214568 RepID=UPI0022FDB9C2|nr:uncharacterized protein J7T55_015350 [Diaporthe amygdali]KAJ0120620.1 hypothetical protein J7T55_015350 [Diaporthe amygdali]
MDNPRQQQLPQPGQQQLQGMTAQQRHALMINNQQQAHMAAKREADLKDRQDRILDMLKPENKHKAVAITSIEQYIAVDTVYRSLRNQDKKGRGATMGGFPKTTADQKARIDQLCTAILDFSNLIDRPNKRSAAEDTSIANTAVEAVKALASIEVQLLAWKILCSTCDAHCGRHNIAMWNKQWKFREYDNFESRFQDVLVAVTRSKSIVKSILDSDVPFAKRIAAAPKDELKLKRGNQAINDKRAHERDEAKKLKRKNDDGKSGNVASDQLLPPGFNEADLCLDGDFDLNFATEPSLQSAGEDVQDHGETIYNLNYGVHNDLFAASTGSGPANNLTFGASGSGAMHCVAEDGAPQYTQANTQQGITQVNAGYNTDTAAAQAGGARLGTGHCQVHTNLPLEPENSVALQQNVFESPAGHAASLGGNAMDEDLINLLSPELQQTLTSLQGLP